MNGVHKEVLVRTIRVDMRVAGAFSHKNHFRSVHRVQGTKTEAEVKHFVREHGTFHSHYLDDPTDLSMSPLTIAEWKSS